MASLLRQIVASPRARHPEAGLDLCYVTDYIVVTSGPSSLWPKKAYRNPLDQLVAFLDGKHGEDWAIFEFRAEGTGYPDEEVYNRIHHFPWPDHHPPPFAIVPNLMASMRNWIQRVDLDGISDAGKGKKRVAVVHCKAGKGRSGTAATSYLISEEGWSREEALRRFTARRMRAGFGNGVSIPSQLRWVEYVDRWTNELNKRYVERPPEVLELHVWGLRDGVKVSIEGFVDNGRRIEVFHVFNRSEKIIVDSKTPISARVSKSQPESDSVADPHDLVPDSAQGVVTPNTQNVILRPTKPIGLPTSDINIDFERRNKAGFTGMTLVTSIAHVWFNTYFEGGHRGDESGVFDIDWDAMDGIKGSIRKGVRALDRLQVVWRYAKRDGKPVSVVITEPEKGQPVPEGEPADWRGDDVDGHAKKAAKRSDGVDSGRPGGSLITMGAMIEEGASSLGKELGLRKQDLRSADLSRASSFDGAANGPLDESGIALRSDAGEGDDEGVQADGPNGEEHVTHHDEGEEGPKDTRLGHSMESGMGKVAHLVSRVRHDERHSDSAASTNTGVT